MAPRRPRLPAVAMALGAVSLATGAALLVFGAVAQQHAPQPSATQAGALGPPAPPPESKHEAPPAPQAVPAERLERLAAALASRRQGTVGPLVARSRPVALDIPAIGVHARVGEVGLQPNGTIGVPPLFADPDEAAWYRYSPTPGQIGPSVIVGHVDNVYGPAVFFRLGALEPGDEIEVTLADGVVTRFVVDGVRSFPKARFPTSLVYGPTNYAALRLVTCGGPFDTSTRQYLDNTVVFASLVPAAKASASS